MYNGPILSWGIKQHSFFLSSLLPPSLLCCLSERISKEEKRGFGRHSQGGPFSQKGQRDGEHHTLCLSYPIGSERRGDWDSRKIIFSQLLMPNLKGTGQEVECLQAYYPDAFTHTWAVTPAVTRKAATTLLVPKCNNEYYVHNMKEVTNCMRLPRSFLSSIYCLLLTFFPYT